MEEGMSDHFRETSVREIKLNPKRLPSGCDMPNDSLKKAGCGAEEEKSFTNLSGSC
jgi:hypothetical protein